MDLYGFAGSPNTWKVRALAHHIGVPLNYRHVDLLKGEQRQPAYLKLSPSGRTPALVDGDVVLGESTALMQYIAAKKPGPLWPDNAADRARIMQWQAWQLQHWGKEACEPLLFERVVKGFFNLGPPDAAVVEKALAAFSKEGGLLDRHLEGREWLVGSGPTLADFSVGAYLFHAEAAGLPLGELRRVKAWFGSLAALPAWAATAPPPMPGAKG
jgi:glutathione S-transferase